MMKFSLTVGAICLASFNSTTADELTDEAAVIDVIDTFFAAMTAKDVESMRSIMTPDGKLYGYREEADGLLIIRPSHSDYLHDLSGSKDKRVERYWNPTITIHGRLATVWTPYDFYRDDEFSHCGINNFSLLKTEEGWKIAGALFSMQQENCAVSPLGPYRAGD